MRGEEDVLERDHVASGDERMPTPMTSMSMSMAMSLSMVPSPTLQ